MAWATNNDERRTMQFLISIKRIYFYLPVLIMFCFTFNADAQTNELFQYVPSSMAKQSQSRALNKKAVYPIQVNHSVSALSIGDRIDLPLLNGGTLAMNIDKKMTQPNGDVQFIGDIEGHGLAVITFGKDSVFANFSNRKHNYGIGLDENRQPFLIDHNASTNTVDLGHDMRFPEGVPFKIPNAFTTKQNAVKATANNKSIVSLLILYSPQFATGFVNPLTRINQMIAFTNAANDRSGVNIEFRLAHSQQVPFDNNANIGTLLDQVTNGTNAFSGVPALRNQYFADLVAVLPFSSGGSVSGIAWVNGNREEYAYSVTQFAVWGSDSVFAHELGHNLGSGHERRSANPSQPSPCSGGFTGYSCGHGNGSEGTIMSYLNDAAWNSVFSNPDLECNGEPCGVARGQSNSADNKTSFNITGPLIEAFRVDTTDGDIKTIGKPTIDPATDVGIFIWETSPNKWVMNFVSAGMKRTVEVDVISQLPLSNIVPLGIESSDVFIQSANGLNMRLTVTPPWKDGAKFTVQNQSSTCVSTTNSNVPIYIGPNRVEMPRAFDLSSLEECDVPNIRTIGKPTIDPATDVGIFIWETSLNKWVMNFVSAGSRRTVEIDVISQLPLSNIVPLGIESSDVFIQSANRLDMRLTVRPPWRDGAKFTVQDQSSTCVSTTNSNVPIYIGPERINVGNDINLSTLTSCQ